MKKYLLVLFCLFSTSLFAQYTVNYESSFRNYLPNTGWVMVSNDTVAATPGLITRVYSGEVLDYMLGVPAQSFYPFTSMTKTSGQTDKILISPPITLGDKPFLRFYCRVIGVGDITVWLVRNVNDTTITGLSDSLRLTTLDAFNVVNLTTAANSTVRIAYRIRGNSIAGYIDEMLVLNKESQAYIPDPCFRNYLATIVPNAVIGDSLNYLHQQVLNTRTMIDTNSCIQSVEGLQYFVFLHHLNLSSNQIGHLPGTVYTFLDTVILKNNQIDFLPTIPYCTYFDLDNNVLRTVPDISNNNCTLFHIRNNIYNGCLPGMNRFVNGDVCNNINVNRNGFFYYTMSCTYPYVPIVCSTPKGTISGIVYFDVNQDSVFNSGDILLQRQRVNFYQGPDLYTNSNGYYFIETDSGLINMEVTSLPPYFTCVNPLADTLNASEAFVHDFRIVATQNVADWQMHISTSGTLTLGNNLMISLDVKNNGTITNSGTVKLFMPPGYTVVVPGLGSIVNDTLFWPVTLNPFQQKATQWLIRVDSFPAGQITTFNAFADVANDINPADNNSTAAVFVMPVAQIFSPWDAGGFPHDPNNKLVATPRVSPGYNDWLDYTINFENTGIANATRVMIRDNIPARLDPYSIELMGASHPCTMLCATDTTIEFLLTPIALTPTSTDSIHSHGHVWFRIKPSAPMQLNDTIRNKADIYFDTQAPIATAYSMVWADTVTNFASGLQLSPNPARLFLSTGPEAYSLHLLYLNGTSTDITADTSVTYTIGDSTIATLSSSMLTPVSVGETTLTASYLNFTNTIPVIVNLIDQVSTQNTVGITVIYPNPFTDEFTVLSTGAYKKIKLTVVNLVGQILIEQSFTKNASDRYPLQVNNLAPGMYNLKVETEGNRQVFLIQKQ